MLIKKPNLNKNGSTKWWPDWQTKHTNLRSFQAFKHCPFVHFFWRAITSIYSSMEPEPNLAQLKAHILNYQKFHHHNIQVIFKPYHVGWQVFRSVITVTNTTFFWRRHFSTQRGMCCMRGWTLMMISGLYFFRPASTFLQNNKQPNSLKLFLRIHSIQKTQE